MKKKISEKCNDENCPFHGNLKTRGRSFVGTVISTKMQKTAIVEWVGWYYLAKYERYAKRKSKVKVHSPDCINAKSGNLVKIMECRPLSKTKKFVILEVLGQEKGFKERMEARDESKVIKKEEKKLDNLEVVNEPSKEELKKQSEKIEKIKKEDKKKQEEEEDATS